MRSKPVIYPIFLPHAGCPFRCVYCNQEALAATPARTGPVEYARSEMERFAEIVRAAGRPGELAFYGSTFTALPHDAIVTILDFAASLVAEGVFSGIRFSTRPDALAPGVCGLLSGYPVRTVEIGVQSFSDAVLAASMRGYPASAASTAARLVKEHGWALGLQLMAGLPGDSKELFLESVRRALALAPNFVRIYPAVVLEGTVLARWLAEGRYRPLSLEEAIDWTHCACELLDRAGVPAARIGLHADAGIQQPGVVVAGPFHPAFGYLVRVRRWRRRVDQMLAECNADCAGKALTVRVPSRYLSEAFGPRRENVRYWADRWELRCVAVEGEPEMSADRVELALEG
jgi:histone acetyltransferase (RNA polymerase elongator complex component)